MTRTPLSFEESVDALLDGYKGDRTRVEASLDIYLEHIANHPEIGSRDEATGERWLMIPHTDFKLWWRVRPHPANAKQPVAIPSQLRSALEGQHAARPIPARLAGIKLCQAYRAQYGDRFVNLSLVLVAVM